MTTMQSESLQFTEGADYTIYERKRLLDKVGFTEPQEAYSIAIPKDWKSQDNVSWNSPGSSCAGTFRQFSASSPGGEYRFDLLPDVIYMWNTNPELMQFYQNNPVSSNNCFVKEPTDAEAYLRTVFVEELGSPQILKISSNEAVIEQMRRTNEESLRELRRYGAADMRFNQTALHADVKWADGSEGIIVLGVTMLETDVPNIYNGTSNKIYTTQVMNRTVFRYPAGESEKGKNMFSVIMASIRTNPAWHKAVSDFWREARQQSHTAHVGKIRMMDEQTRQIGEQAIRNGAERLKNMDAKMRSWEQSQSTQDRMHTEFIKTIREVENYRDESGKYEVAAGYDHVWSRSDGSSFIVTNSPGFDPSVVFQDQNWKEMKKVR